MSIALVKRDEPEFGDGDEGGGECGAYRCEWCEGEEFALATWRGINVGVCTGCHMPQSALTWVFMEGEE